MAAITNPRARSFPIGELSRRTGVNAETIRYYERVKLLPPAVRTAGGRRVYGPSDERALAFIRRGRELGFTLDQVRALLGLSAPGQASCAEVKTIASEHLADVRAKRADLARLEAILADAVSRCTDDFAPVCPVLDVLDHPAAAVPRAKSVPGRRRHPRRPFG